MKKFTVIALAVAMIFAFASCGSGSSDQDLSDSKYVGTWRAETMSKSDESMEFNSEFVLTLNGDGTGQFYSNDPDEGESTSDINWELTDEGFKTTGGTKLKFTDEGDNIKTTIMSVDLIFSKDDGSAEAEADDGLEGNRIGYAGSDPAEYAVCKYLVDNIASEYSEAEYHLAYGTVVDRDDSNADDVLIKGTYWVENYDLEGDTLKFVSGGNHAGCFHLKTNDDGTFEVTSFDQVLDGGEYEPSAKEIFGDKYEDFSKAQSDDEANKAARLEAVTVFVNANEIPATQYQDEGWDPVELHL